MIIRKHLFAAGLGAALAGTLVAGLQAASAPGPKGYVIGEITVNDAEAYKPYAAAVPPIIARFGGAYLVRGGKTAALEGVAPAGRVVVIEFPSVAAARAFEDSPEYQAIAPIRRANATSRVFIAEGTGP